MMRIAVLIIVLLFSANAAQANNTLADARFIASIQLIKNRIAANANEINSFSSDSQTGWQNIVTDKYPSFDKVQLDGYRRALVGAALVLRDGDLEAHQAIFYNPAYDIALVTAWSPREGQLPILEKAYLVPGELIRGQSIVSGLPGWLSAGALSGVVDAYQQVLKSPQPTSYFLTRAVEDTTYNLAGTELTARDVVHGRVLTISVPLYGHPIASYPQIGGAIKSATIGFDISKCLKTGPTLQDGIACVQAKHPFAELALPKNVKDPQFVSQFLQGNYVEGVVNVGEENLGFIATTMPENNFSVIFTTSGDTLLGVSLVDLAEQP